MEDGVSVDGQPLLKGAPNFRDFGGHAAADGRRVRLGQLFRSQVLSEIEDDDVAALGRLGITAVCDLRSADERARQVNRWPADVVAESILPLEALPDIGAMKPSEWLRRLQAARFEPAAAAEHMRSVYRKMPGLYADRLAHLLRYLARPDAGPVLVHCTAGKDRTGFACAMILHALGVPLEAVRADYLESARLFTFDMVLARMERYVGGPVPDAALDALRKLAGVEGSYLAALIDGILESHGSVDAWLAAAAGLDPATRESMRRRLLQG